MPKFTNKETQVVVDIGDDDVLPGGEAEWEPGTGSPKRRRRTDTGSVPVQNN